MKNKKRFAGFKQFEGEGRGLAVFATMNVIDKDRDVTLPGAFGEQRAKLAPAHDWSAPNIGMVDVREIGNEAIADFKFYMDMPSASEWYRSMKANFDNGVPQEFSYGFSILDSSYGEFEGQQVRFLKRLQVHEVSPVMLGAGVNTRTLDMKSAEGMTLEEHFEEVIAAFDAAKGFVDRSEALAALRAKEGRTLSRANRERLSALSGRLRDLTAEAHSLRSDIDTLLRETEPQPEDPGKVAKLFAEFQRISAEIGGHLSGR